MKLKNGQNEEKYERGIKVKNILHCSACSPNIYMKKKKHLIKK